MEVRERRPAIDNPLPGDYEKAPDVKTSGALIKSLAVTYFHMGRPHTIIGAKRFHFRVRDGIGWFTFAMAARQFS